MYLTDKTEPVYRKYVQLTDEEREEVHDLIDAIWVRHEVRVKELAKKDFENKLCNRFPEYWECLGENFKIKHYLGNAYDNVPEVINYEAALKNICSRAEIISEKKQNELSKLMDDVEGLNEA